MALVGPPYRCFYEPALAERALLATSHELRRAYAVLIAVSAVQLASGAQLTVGALGVAAGVAGLYSIRRT